MVGISDSLDRNMFKFEHTFLRALTQKPKPTLARENDGCHIHYREARLERMMCSTGGRLRIPVVSIRTLSRTKKSRLFIIGMSRKLDIGMHITVDILGNKYEVTVFREEEDDSDDEWEGY